MGDGETAAVIALDVAGDRITHIWGRCGILRSSGPGPANGRLHDMGRYDDTRARTGFGIPHDGTVVRGVSVPELLAMSRDPDPSTRQVAVKNLCPCHLKRTVAEVWDRLLVLAHDPDPGVRRDAVHALGDGSPRDRQQDVLNALRSLRNDPDRRVRRQVTRALAGYRRTGSVNAL